MAHQPATAPTANDGSHDFDFFFGTWRQENRKRVRPLVKGDTEWVEFESRSEAWPIVAGLGNVDTFKAPRFPGRPGFEGFSLRLFEPETGLWRIWWASTVGHGQLECEDVIDRVPLRVRFTWKDITATSATWEQAFSFDEGETWDTNWVTMSTRIG
jgi:hypothetical protein